jgi:ABC-2 type transport system ATP-binding protein
MAAPIEVRDLTVVRGGTTALDQIDLSVEPGRVTGLLGPSGCGKTTLMRALVGVQVVESGSVNVLGSPAGSPELRARVGYVTQAPSVYGDLSVRENLRYFAAIEAADSHRIDQVLDSVGLAKLAGRVVHTLSGGERARVSLATALLGEPELLILDEPTVGLDPVLRRDLWQMFRSLARDGTTLLVSSHVMDEASECDVLILMRDGHIVAVDEPDDLRARTGEQDLCAAFLKLIEEPA